METTDAKQLKIRELGGEVMKLARNTLTINLRFMDSAISRLLPVRFDEAGIIPPVGAVMMTEGRHLYYSPENICVAYARHRERAARLYMHALMHCVFRHFAPPSTADRCLWNIACDMAVEASVNGLELTCLEDRDAEKQSVLDLYAKKTGGLLTAEKLYAYLRGANPPDSELTRLAQLFLGDDHDLWYPENGIPKASENGSPQRRNTAKGSSGRQKDENSSTDDESGDSADDDTQDDADDGTQGGADDEAQSSAEGEAQDGADGGAQDSEDGEAQGGAGGTGINQSGAQPETLEDDWRDVAERIQIDLESFSKAQGDTAGSMMQNLQAVNREKYDYTEFLKKFAVMGEAMRINDEEFDYVFYTYGMKLFPEKRMPLIEPLEYKDIQRIREFVIAIDTSGSVAGSQVQSFLQKTYNILKNGESFMSRFNLHIIQCDASIQEHVKITNQQEFDYYIENMSIKGLGGTDFRPVFDTVNRMIEEHEFNNLKGLIYFTDGLGTFPQSMPAYRTAFVFVDDGYSIPQVPAWAIKLILDKEELN